MTVEGRQWIANLYCNVFEIEHGRRRMGPQTTGRRAVEGDGGVAKGLGGKPRGDKLASLDAPDAA